MSTERRGDRPPEDAAIATAWRRVSREEPPATVDAAILAAAHTEAARVHPAVGADSRRARWSSWQPLAAAAAVAGLAFVLVQVVPRPETQMPLRPATVESEETTGDAAAQREATPGASAEQDSAGAGPPRVEHPEIAAPLSEAPAPASASQEATRVPPPAAAPAARIAPRDSPDATSTPGTRAPAAEFRSEARATTDVTGVAVDQDSAVEDRIRRIVALHGTGDFEAAGLELRALRHVQPDADRLLPPELHDWANTVSRDP